MTVEVEVNSKDSQMPETTSIGEATKAVVETNVVEEKEKEVAVEAVEEKEKDDGAVEEKKMEEEKKTEVGAVEENATDLAAVGKSSSFKEETSIASDLKEYEKKALNDLKSRVEAAILENKIFKKKEVVEKKEKPKQEEKEKENEEKAEEKSTSEVEEKEEEKPVEEKEKTVEEVKAPAEEEEKEKVVEDKGKAVEEEKIPIEEATTEEKSVEEVAVDKDITLWGIPLLPSKGVAETDVVLFKFLRARDFRVGEALDMLINTLQWRKDYKSDSILDEEMNPSLDSVAYMEGVDREGHPICFNVYGSFQNTELYQKTFGTEEQRQQFLRWRVQLMEKGIQKLDFTPGGVCSLLQINDLKNTPGPSKKELRVATKQAVALLQDNYPEFVARNIFINVPFWYYAFNALLSPFLTQRTKSKFVFARPSNVSETLLKYIPANEIPTKYGGLKREKETEFSTEEVSELIVKSGSTETVEIPAPEAGTTLVWDLTVSGWEVNYKEEFVPSDEGSYTIIVQKAKKVSFNEEPTRNTFTNSEPGKVVLTVENGSFKKKRILYRYKVKKSCC